MNDQAFAALEKFVPRPVDAWMFEDARCREQIEMQIAAYPSYVLPSVERPAAICGIITNCGIGSVWLVTGVGFERQAPIIVKQLRQLCDAAYQVFKLHRLHMLVDSDDKAAKFFAEKLGFICEAERLKKLGARGQDLDIYLLERNEAWAE